MKLVSVTKPGDMVLTGIHVEFVTEDKAIKEVILSVPGDETSYTIKVGDTYSTNVKVFKRVTHELVERYRLSGTVLGISVAEDFATQAEAETAMNRLSSASSDVDLVISTKLVRVDDQGTPTPFPFDSDIPF